MPAPEPGAVVDGYRFRGGNPNDQASWEPVPSSTPTPQTQQYNAGGLEVLGEGYYRNQQGSTYREGPRGGFMQVGGPSAGQVTEASNAAVDTNKALRSVDLMDGLLAQADKLGPQAWLDNPSNTVMLDQAQKDLMLRLKEMYNLGVINGPDLQLMESVVGNPTELRNAIVGGTLRPKLARIAGNLGNDYRLRLAAFQGQGGRATVMAPMFQSPRSEYAQSEWGRDGTVPQAAYSRTQAARGSPQNRNTQTRVQAAAPVAGGGINALAGNGFAAARMGEGPAPSPSTARPAAPQGPPASILSEGVNRRVRSPDGQEQVWTLRNGKPVRLR